MRRHLAVTAIVAATLMGQPAPAYAPRAEASATRDEAAPGAAKKAPGPTARYASIWTTSAKTGLRLTPGPSVALTSRTGGGGGDIVVDRSQTAQTITGFGASMTGASASLIGSLPADRRAALMSALFGTSGIGISTLRQPMGASDFNAPGNFYSYADSTTPDPTLSTFSVAVDETNGILPLLRHARTLNPQLAVSATPWSAPAWMKTSNQMMHGSLKPEYVDVYASYFVKFLQAYAAHGVPVSSVSPVNEPNFGTVDYPSMVMPPEQQVAVVQAMDAAFGRAGLATGIWVFDHNWDSSAYATQVLHGTEGLARVHGAAVHCYSDNQGAIADVRALGKRATLSECTGTDTADTWTDTLMWQTRNLLVNAVRHGAEGVSMWNIALDAEGGPHQGYCAERCNGLVEIADGDFTMNPDYYVIGHAAKFVRPGATVVASTSADAGPVRTVAFRNPDGTMAMLVQNDHWEARTVRVVDGREQFTLELAPWSVSTVTW